MIHDDKQEAAEHFKETFDTTVDTNEAWIACLWRLIPDGRIQRVITTRWQWPNEAHAGMLETLENNLREVASQKVEVEPLPEAETIGRFMDRVEEETARRLAERNRIQDYEDETPKEDLGPTAPNPTDKILDDLDKKIMD